MRLFLVALLTISVIGQSQTPPPRTGKEQQPNQKNTGSKPENSETCQTPPQNTPPALNQSQTIIREQGAQQGGTKAIDSPSSNGWITFFTAILAIAALAQFVAMWLQRGYMHKQWREMKAQVEISDKNADTASRNAQVAINSVRPWIVPDIQGKKETVYKGADARTITFFYFSIENIGSSPAEILSIDLVSDKTRIEESLPPEPIYQPADLKLTYRIVPPKQPWNPFQVPEGWKAPPVEDWSVFTHWRFGRVIYRDLLNGGKHETRFCFSYCAAPEAYVPDGPERYHGYT